MRIATMLGFAAVMFATPALLHAETVKVTGRSPVNLQLFSCNEIHRTKVVKRVCYEGTYDYMLVLEGKKYVQYCAVDDKAVQDFLDAANKDRYYDKNIKKHFNCRGKKVPDFA
jgi:hypothetical protein